MTLIHSGHRALLVVDRSDRLKDIGKSMDYFSKADRFPRALVARCFVLLYVTGSLVIPAAVFAEDKKEPPKDAAAPAAAPVEAAVVLESGSDYICQADVSFTWRPDPPPPPKHDPAAPAQPKQPTPVPTPAPVMEPIKEYFTLTGEQGMVEKEVRERLTAKLPEIRRQATEACRAAHQDFSGCVSSKLRTTYDQYVKLDFTARRTMIDAIDTDCQHRMGICISDEASEIRCHINRSPDTAPKVEAEPAKEKEKKK